MDNFLLIFICMTLGFLFRKVKKFPASTAQALNSFVIYVSFPAVVFVQIPQLLKTIEFGPKLLIPVTMSWIVFIVSALIFSIIGNKLGWSKKTIGAIILTAGLGNTSFVGFPLLEALIGPHSIQVAILIDQLGTFMACSTLGVFFASLYSKSTPGKTDFRKIFLNILKFPPFIALVFVSVYSLLGFQFPEMIQTAAKKIAITLVPLALFAVGFQLNVKRDILAIKWRQLSLGLGYKLFLAPTMLVLFYSLFYEQRSEIIHITLLESAMAPMITAAVIASEFELDSELGNLMVGIGIPLSLITVSLWHYFL